MEFEVRSVLIGKIKKPISYVWKIGFYAFAGNHNYLVYFIHQHPYLDYHEKYAVKYFWQVHHTDDN